MPSTSADDPKRSSKLFAANQQQPKGRRTFYVDENLGKKVPQALIDAGYDVRPWYDHFPGAKDVEYLPVIGANGWILITKDQNIRRNRLEVEAIVNAGVRAFVLTGADMRGDEQAALVVRVMKKIDRVCAQRGPFVYTITRTGLFQQISNRRLLRASRQPLQKAPKPDSV